MLVSRFIINIFEIDSKINSKCDCNEDRCDCHGDACYCITD